MIQKLKQMLIILFLFLLFTAPLHNHKIVQAATIKISSQSFTLSVNHYKTLSVKGTSKKVTWYSSNKTVATVSSGGRVTARTPGTATIYASVSGKKLSCKVTVIKLNSSSAAVAAGASKSLKVYGTSRAVVWSSSNKKIATVSSGGKVTGKTPGTATIYASVLGKKLSCSVNVLKLNSSSSSLAIGEKKTLKVSGTSSTVTWSTSKSSIATVNSKGVITAKAAGTVSITAAVKGIKLSSKITVKSALEAGTTSVLSIANSTNKANKTIAYYAAWSRYSGFTPDRIDAVKLTHINYAFANINSDLKICLGYPDVDVSNINGLNQLKLVNPNLKTIISVGGYSWSGRFSDVALTDESRSIFADSCVDFIVKYGFDGIDIDWEYPVTGGLPNNVKRPFDKYNFTLLLRTLRDKLDKRETIDGKKYILSFAAAAGPWYLNNIELSKINEYVDYVNVMTYDLHGIWESYTNFNAPLYSDDPLLPHNISVDKCIKNWLSTGFPKNKIIMGVPFYGYIYKAVPNVNNGFNQTYSGGSSISYHNILANYLNAIGYKQYFSSYSRVPWLFNESTFITYENEQSIAEKAQYIRNNGLGGIMIWEISQDPNNILLNSLYNEMK